MNKPQVHPVIEYDALMRMAYEAGATAAIEEVGKAVENNEGEIEDVFLINRAKGRYTEFSDKQLNIDHRPKRCQCLIPGNDDGQSTCFMHHDCNDGSCTHRDE